MELLEPLWQRGLLGVFLALSLMVNVYLFKLLIQVYNERLSESLGQLEAFYKLANEWALLLRDLSGRKGSRI